MFDNKKVLWFIFIALIFRVFLALGSDNINHPDENFQIKEQAHRLVFGYGIIPWEYRYDARSWLVPGLTALFLYPFRILGLDNPQIYIPGLKIIMGLLSLMIVLSAYKIGRTVVSLKAGLWAAFLCAVWYDLVYFSIKPLSEVWATTFIIISIALIIGKPNRLQITIGAILACLGAAIRINYVPAVLVLTIWCCYKLANSDRKLYLWSFIGTVGFIGLLEWVTIGAPFLSYYNFVRINQTYFIAGSMGSTFSHEYLLFLGYGSFFIFWAFLSGSLFQWKIQKILTIMVVVTLISNMLIPAKDFQSDFRHIFLVIPMLLIIGAIAVDKLLDRLSVSFGRIGMGVIAAVFLSITVLGAYGKLPAQRKIYEGKIFNPAEESIFYRRPELEAYKFLNNLPELSGIYDISQLWFRSGAYYYLHRDIPIYWTVSPPKSIENISHIITSNPLPYSPDFKLIKNFDNILIYSKNGHGFARNNQSGFDYNIYQPGVDDIYFKKN
jgi:hypothetical protein